MSPLDARCPNRNLAGLLGSFVQNVSVRFEYSVQFTEGVFEASNLALVQALADKEPGRRHRAYVIVDDGVASAWPALAGDIAAYFTHHGERLELVDGPKVVPGGEPAKNDEALVRELLERFHQLGLDRHAYVVAVGGGAVLDAVGYAAAIAHRGLRHVRLPSTTLAMADSGVGVKNGINAFGKKNFLGTFVPPRAVLCDVRFLRTLSARDRIAGTAEAVKVALVREPAFFTWLEENAEALAAGDEPSMVALVERSAAIHLRHIATSGDPFEMGSARPLDFGHWAAHKLESLSDHRLRHGEAVAIGIALDSVYSSRIGLCSAESASRVLRLLDRLGFPLWDATLELAGAGGALRVLEGLDEFREHLGGELTVTMLRGLGEGVEIHEVDAREVLASLQVLRAR